MIKYVIPIGTVAIIVLIAILTLRDNKLDFNNDLGITTQLENQTSQPEPLTQEEATIAIKMSDKEVLITDGVRHTVPLDQIVGGGPAKDGIPSIDNPAFISVKEAEDFLSDTEPGLAYSDGTTHRFYPFQILVWHEIVNDHVNDKKVLITYCPLCLTASVFDPIVNGERVEFGTSGKLWQSNLVMYDRKTDTYWSQVLGEAIKGDLAGTKLPLLTSDQMLFGNWKKQFPNGEVLSKDTGTIRFYGSSPYGSYFDVQNFSLSLVSNTDKRLSNETFVFGIEIDGKAKAYSTSAVKQVGEITDMFNGTTFVLKYDEELDVVRMSKQLPDGSLERVNPISGFWFSWVAAHPDTEVYK